MLFTQFIAVLIPMLATLLGGWLVWRTQSPLRPWLSISGGIILGLVYFDLLPEAFEHAAEFALPLPMIGAVIVGAILIFHILDKLFDYHGHEGHEHDCHNDKHRSINSWLRVSGMGFHAFLDGLAIGGGFAANTRLGVLVTVALALHKLSDGMSLVTLIKLRHGLDKQRAFISMALLMLLPILGLLIGTSIQPSEKTVTLFIAFLAGFFTHLSLSELLPEAHQEKPYRFGLVLTVAGMIVMGFVSVVSH